MNIAITGPEKFLLQDMICVEAALALGRSGGCSLVPEPEAGEDARIVWPGATPCTLEVQVKGGSEALSVSKLVEHLAHYPARKDTPSLLRRLMDESETYAAFVLSSRVCDDLVELLTPQNRLDRPQARHASRRLAKAVRQAVINQSASTLKKAADPKEKVTALDIKRAEEQADVALRSEEHFRQALGKIALVERETAESVEIRLHRVLQEERFDTPSIRGIIGRLTDTITQAKRSQKDVVPDFLELLRVHAPAQLQPANYTDRGTEDALLQVLKNQQCLLLAGPPRAGKTWTSLTIGSVLQADGVAVRTGSHVDEAERYLTDPVDGHRAYILDDPLGSREPIENPSAVMADLARLSARLQAGRYLIVAQTENVLLQVRGTSELSRCRLGSHSWTSLARLPASVATEIWRSSAEAQGLSEAAIVAVKKIIEESDQLCEPGALAYLAQTWSELPNAPTDAEILAQSRRDAIDFARSLSDKHTDARSVLIAAAIGTEIHRPISEPDLAYMISSSEQRPGFVEEFASISLGGDWNPAPPPAYEAPCELSQQARAALTILQRRRVLWAEESDFNFTHPYLRAGAQALAVPDIPQDRALLLEQLQRALGCASPITSLAAAQNLRWMRLAFQGHHGAGLFELAKLGTRSKFPATRDSCFAFLVQFVDELPQELRDDLPWIAEDMVISLEQIDVDSGIGFISSNYNFFETPPTLESIQPYLDAIEDGRSIALDLALSKRILQALAREPKQLTSKAAERLLRADEATIRAFTANCWISTDRQDDEGILDLIARDRTPAMSARLLKALAHSWATLDPSRRERICSIIEDQLRVPSCASVLYTRLVLFNRVEEFGKSPPWELFARLLPRALDCMPHTIALRDGRLNAVVDDAMKQLPTSAMGDALEAWINRIIRRVDAFTLDEYELSVTEPLLKLATDERRYRLISVLLTAGDTGLRLVTISRLIESWTELPLREAVLVLSSLRSSEQDALWLKAVALTTRSIPASVARWCIDQSSILPLNSTEVEQLLGKELFSACIYVHCGWPQPLWWYGTHHRSDKWADLVFDIAARPDHELHPLALIEVLSHQEGAVSELLSTFPQESLFDTYLTLLRFQAGTNANWLPEAWEIMIDRLLKDKDLGELAAAADPVIEGVIERVFQIRLWLKDCPLAGSIRKLVENDYKSMELIDTLDVALSAIDSNRGELSTEQMRAADMLRQSIFEPFVAAIEECKPRLHRTWSDLKYVLSRRDCPEELLSRLEVGRLQAFEKHRRVRDTQAVWPAKPTLTGWRDAQAPS
ncbi:hypothetical protein [Stenotrophomonas maltophilia]|nr:hypothetical protein [Stenotrophomonas maltophilia]MBA0251205.1 hypothetical protein [Stenotrophomonas maltophilia]MBA0319390.1 hypothetical protein [Stenotrophomonas maltophilia]MCU1146192.1 hypothetical protein [Stenotrophomonas maltophilia]QGL93438.1 hypothetical protein FEO92_14160 [Stenotrophomonas maltophilia]HEL4147629.1 hypothetical protein [Stenotrophomonas maltophilia]